MNEFLRGLLSIVTGASRRPARRARLGVESLEGREVPSASPLVAHGHPPVVLAHVAHLHHPVHHAHHVHGIHHHLPVRHGPLTLVTPLVAPAPDLTGDTFSVLARYYPGAHRFHDLKIQTLTPTTGTTNDGGPVVAANGTWGGVAWSGTAGWHPSLNDFALDVQWADGGKTYHLNADVTPPTGSWTARDLALEGRLDDGSLLSLVHGQQTSGLHLWPTGGVNLLGDSFTVYSQSYPGVHHFHSFR